MHVHGKHVGSMREACAHVYGKHAGSSGAPSAVVLAWSVLCSGALCLVGRGQVRAAWLCLLTTGAA